jgi:hypothetical protein
MPAGWYQRVRGTRTAGVRLAVQTTELWPRHAPDMTFIQVEGRALAQASRGPRGIFRGTAHLGTVAIAALLLLSGCGGGDGSSGSDGARDTGFVAKTRSVDQGAASPRHCDGRIGRTSVDEVDVPPGATCTLQRTTVNGNVSVGAGGTLVARGVAVDGDVEGEGARLVAMTGHSWVGGNLQLEQGGSSAVSDSQIRGDLQTAQQTGALAVLHNSVGGNLQVGQNSGRVTISGNRIGGDLECEQNTPAPRGSDNRVSGHRAGQCADSRRSRTSMHRSATPQNRHRQTQPRHAHQRPRCAGDSVSDDPSDDQCDGGGED